MRPRSREIPRILGLLSLGVLAVLLAVLVHREAAGESPRPLYRSWKAWLFLVLMVGLYVSYLKQHLRRAAGHLVDEKIRTHRLLECLPQAVLVLDEDRRVLAANASAERLLGGAGCLGTPLSDLARPEGGGKDFPAGQSRARLPSGTCCALALHPVAPEAGASGGAVAVLLPEPGGTGARPPGPCAPGAFLDEALGVHAEALARRRVSVRRTGDWGAKGLSHPAGLRTAVRELLGNAIRLAPEGSEIALSVDRDGDRLRVRILNAGPAIPEDQAEGIPGGGVRLARTCLEASGGSLRLEGAEGRGTRATLDLPSAPAESSSPAPG